MTNQKQWWEVMGLEAGEKLLSFIIRPEQPIFEIIWRGKEIPLDQVEYKELSADLGQMYKEAYERGVRECVEASEVWIRSYLCDILGLKPELAEELISAGAFIDGGCEKVNGAIAVTRLLKSKLPKEQ